MVTQARRNAPELRGLLQYQITVTPPRRSAALTCACNGAGTASKTPFYFRPICVNKRKHF